MLIHGSVQSKIVASDLLEERQKCDFDQQELGIAIHGGVKVYEKKMEFQQILAKHDELGNHHKFFEMSIDEQQTDLWRKNRFLQINYPDYWTRAPINKYPYIYWPTFTQGLPAGVGMHYTMFQAAVEALGNQQQIQKWMPLIEKHKILGCYAQTELGHGSNVAQLETTATLDMKTDEIVIHSPTITSTKFWPGDLGRFSTHAIVFARLKVGDQDFGVNAFIVQLRDLNTYKHLPGIRTGDLGPKLGYQSKDNGWATFTQVRIPRTNMLMRISELSKSGEFSIKGDPRVLYTTMMVIRLNIVTDVQTLNFLSCLIALRYASVRRQFSTIEGQKVERKIIDYQTFQSQITPLLAESFVHSFVSCYMREQFKLLQQEVEKNEFGRMDLMHHLLAGLKAQFSDQSVILLDKCRRSCGGAGYQSNSGFTELFSAGSPLQTLEGENTVMLLQSARFVFKLYARAQTNQVLPAPFEYLNQIKNLLNIKGKGNKIEDFFDVEILRLAFAVRSIVQIVEVVQNLKQSNEPQKVKDNEIYARMKLDMIKAHIKCITLEIFKIQVDQAQFKDSKIKLILEDLCKIYALNSLIEDCGAVFESGYFAPAANKHMKQALDLIIKKVRPYLIPLVESYTWPQNLLPTNIGNFYGDIYEQQLQQAMDSGMNKLDKDGVPPQWESYIKPFLHGKL